jgi:hypothetical protein
VSERKLNLSQLSEEFKKLNIEDSPTSDISIEMAAPMKIKMHTGHQKYTESRPSK